MIFKKREKIKISTTTVSSDVTFIKVNTIPTSSNLLINSIKVL